MAMGHKLCKDDKLSEACSRRILGTEEDRLKEMLDSAQTELGQVKPYLEQVTLENRRLKFEAASLKEENDRHVQELTRLMEALTLKEEEVRGMEAEAKVKEEAFPAKALEWTSDHLEEVVDFLSATPARTMDFFQTLFKKAGGKKMIEAIGTYGFQMGQKKEQTWMYWLMKKRGPSFEPSSWKLPPPHKEEPVPPFPLE